MLAAKLLGASGTAVKTYVDDVFSAWTFSGTGASQVITNGIDLSGKGGMVWQKIRNSGANWHRLHHSARGTSLGLYSNDTSAQGSDSYLTAFGSTGFTHGTTLSSAYTLIAWTFRNADNFYSHTTVTKSAGSNATVSFANLTTLGMVRVKRTDAAGSWYIWHRSLTAGKLLIGETTAAEATLGHITVSGTTVTLVNGVIADGTYLVEGFAHDTGTDGLIQCGSFTTDGSGNATVSLGWEPQFVLRKRTDSTSQWTVEDTSRGMSQSGAKWLYANTSDSELDGGGWFKPTATGFTAYSMGASVPFIYLAIRRPNKPPTTGTQVLSINTTSTDPATLTTGFPVDLCLGGKRSPSGSSLYAVPRLTRGFLYTQDTSAEGAGSAYFKFDSNTSIYITGWLGTNAQVYWNFKRAPGVFDVVCYTGTGAATTVSHGLGAVPELMIVRNRPNAGSQWVVYSAALANTEHLLLSSTAAKATVTTYWNSTTPTSSSFTIGTASDVNQSATAHVAYLFATLAGISKVGSYTGNGSSQTIACGFTTGARFILIKRTSAAGDWYVWDTVRGIVAGNDGHLSLNVNAEEVTTDDSIDPDTSGFIVNQLAATNINVTSATYIFLALA